MRVYMVDRWAGESSRKPRRPRPYSRHCWDALRSKCRPIAATMRKPCAPHACRLWKPYGFYNDTARLWGCTALLLGRALAALGISPTKSAIANLAN